MKRRAATRDISQLVEFGIALAIQASMPEVLTCSCCASPRIVVRSFECEDSGRINAVFAGDLIARETMMQAADTSVEPLPVAPTLDQESSRKRQGCFFESARLPDSYRAVNCVGR